MDSRSWLCRHRLAVDVAIAVVFVLLDTGTTLVGATWWPAHPGTLAWAMLGVQALACSSLVARRRAPLAVVAVLGAFTLVVTLLISPFGVITPGTRRERLGALRDHAGGVRADLLPAGPATTACIALAVFTVIVARPWQPSVAVITIGLLRTAVGPLLALYFDARRRLVRALTERAERAERERHLLAEQARAEERARLAGEMHDVVTHRVSLMVLQAGALRMTARRTRRPGRPRRTCARRAARRWTSCATWSASCAPRRRATRRRRCGGFAALVAESTAVGTPGRADRGRRPGAGLAGGRAHRVPDRT